MLGANAQAVSEGAGTESGAGGASALWAKRTIGQDSSCSVWVASWRCSCNSGLAAKAVRANTNRTLPAAMKRRARSRTAVRRARDMRRDGRRERKTAEEGEGEGRRRREERRREGRL